MKILFVILISFIFSFNSLKAQMNDTTVAQDKGLEIQSILIDDTHSKIGKDFYDAFYNIWEFPLNGGGHTIVISEKTSPGLGTLIIISIDDEELISQNLQPNYDIIVEFAQNCAIYLQQYFENYKDIQQELQGNDLKGTGIY